MEFSTKTTTEKKKRVLCLHGYGTNGTILRNELTDITNILGDEFVFEYIDAPHEQYEDGFKWWERVGDGRYIGLEESMQFVIDYINKEGPYHAVLGVSQGGAFNAYLSAMKERGEIEILHQWDKSVFIVAHNVMDIEYNEKLFGDGFKLKSPSFHIVGTEDPLRPSTWALLEHFDLDSKQHLVTMHDHGHQAPNLELSKDGSAKKAIELLGVFLRT